ncbi:MAG: MarR family winged helix-turn-helix transcriptional regulator [Guyparkeria sp.]|uniref:MarR family winged helix-turn-helix transcriptional regulator n=1 Tax=Guyparkeria sp. TaxID=2035736 RepID=UPI00397CC885
MTHFTDPATDPVQQREDEITRLVFDVSRLWRVQVNETLSEFDLTASAWAVLRILRDEGEGRTQKELAGELAIEGPTLVKLLDGLERGDWIERRISETDRRAKTIWLRPEAHARIEAADKALARFRHQVLGALTDEEKRDYMTLSRKVRDLLKSL